MTERYSRIDIYDYVYNLFYDVVTKNVYSMFEPQELTTSDTNDGFLVIRVGDLYDESEFTCSAYGWARVYVEAYVPPLSRGRLDYTKYQEYEDAINLVIANAIGNDDGDFSIQEQSVLSMDTNENSNADNQFFLFVKSFIVVINK